MQNKDPPSLSSLPSDLLLDEILPLLDLKSVLSLRCTNRHFHTATCSRRIWLHLAKDLCRRLHLTKPDEPWPETTSPQLESFVFHRHTIQRAWNARQGPKFTSRTVKAPTRRPVVLPGARWLLSMDSVGSRIFVTDLDRRGVTGIPGLPSSASDVLIRPDEYIQGSKIFDPPDNFTVWIPDPSEPKDSESRLMCRVAAFNGKYRAQDSLGKTWSCIHLYDVFLEGSGTTSRLTSRLHKIITSKLPGESIQQFLNPRYFVQLRLFDQETEDSQSTIQPKNKDKKSDNKNPNTIEPILEKLASAFGIDENSDDEFDNLIKPIGGGHPIPPDPDQDLSCPHSQNATTTTSQLITEDPPSDNEALFKAFGGVLQAFVEREEPYTTMYIIPYKNSSTTISPTIVTLPISSFAVREFYALPYDRLIIDSTTSISIYPIPTSSFPPRQLLTPLYTIPLPSPLNAKWTPNRNIRHSPLHITPTSTLTIYQTTNQTVSIRIPHNNIIPPIQTHIMSQLSESTGVLQVVGLNRTVRVHWAGKVHCTEITSYPWEVDSQLDLGDVKVMSRRLPPIPFDWVLKGACAFDEGRGRIVTMVERAVNVIDVIPVYQN